jgi:hypothetical protein
MEQTNQTEVQTPTVPQVTQPTAVLMTTLMALIDNYIRDIVTTQVNEILMSHRTLRVIDEGFTQQIKEIATAVVEGAISDHNDEEYHIGEDAINDMAVSALEDHDFDDKINEAVNDAINDFDFTDVITASIKDNITFSATISVD